MATNAQWIGTNATGLRGFLAWLRTFQPALYKRIVPELAARYPHDFGRPASMAGLGATAASGSLIAPISLNLAPAPSVSAIDATTAAASDTAPSSGATSWLSGVINSLSSAYLTYNQAKQQSQIVNAQLQRAAAGQTPLTVTNTQSGIPQISTGGLSTGVILAGVGLIVAALIFAKKRRP